MDPFCNEIIEQSIIGTIAVYGNSSYDVAVSIVTCDDFYFPELRDVWNAFGQIVADGHEIEFNSLDMRLQSAGWYSREKLVAITDYSKNPALLEQNCLALVSLADKRDLHGRVVRAAKVLETGGNLHDARAIVESAKVREPSPIITMSDALSGIEVSDPFTEDPTRRGIATGIQEVDAMLTFGGVKRGAVTVIAAESSKGKSTLASQIADNASLLGLTVLDVTMEDDETSRSARCLSRLTGIPNERIQRGDIAQSELRAFEEGKDELARRNIFFLSRIPRNSSHLCGIVRRFGSTQRIDLLIVDYVQLIPGSSSKLKKMEVMDEAVGEISRLALENKEMAVILVSQFNRSETNQKPTKDSLYHSGFIGQAAHTIMLIWEPKINYDKFPLAKNCRHIIIDKQKNGRTGDVIAGWDGEHVMFKSADPINVESYREAIEDNSNRRRK